MNELARLVKPNHMGLAFCYENEDYKWESRRLAT